ncbi:uncharacterized protein C5orf47 homolog [Equus asinus]|uniref:uncharacterized protein C5orf47 homolog n=1 Tax=Equus asinus TaxID=9793 RepID=UPI0038F820CD
MAAAGGGRTRPPAACVYVARFGAHRCGGVLQLGGRRSPGLGATCSRAGAPDGGGRPPGPGPRPPAAPSDERASSAQSSPAPVARAGGAKGRRGQGDRGAGGRGGLLRPWPPLSPGSGRNPEGGQAGPQVAPAALGLEDSPRRGARGGRCRGLTFQIRKGRRFSRHFQGNLSLVSLLVSPQHSISYFGNCYCQMIRNIPTNVEVLKDSSGDIYNCLHSQDGEYVLTLIFYLLILFFLKLGLTQKNLAKKFDFPIPLNEASKIMKKKKKVLAWNRVYKVISRMLEENEKYRLRLKRQQVSSENSDHTG